MYETRPTMTHEQFVMDVAERETHSDSMVAPGPMERELRDQIQRHAAHLREVDGDERVYEFMQLPLYEPYPCGA